MISVWVQVFRPNISYQSPAEARKPGRCCIRLTLWLEQYVWLQPSSKYVSALTRSLPLVSPFQGCPL
ncbi:MAG: hypothetical protein QE493_03360 [Verrucomicrobiae bacterium]|nr:hypothetical protein [Verrucomicrobiae bacterium]